MRVWLLALSISLLFGLGVGQDLKPVVKQVAPESYPPAARAVRASGRVGVAVNVDYEGKVILAEVFSGHPLLKASAVGAAKNWMFEAISEQDAERNFVLFFDYKPDSEEKIIEESDKEWLSSIRLNSISPFEIEVLTEIQIPRFLKLPRTDGKLAKESCPLHNVELLAETQPVNCTNKNELYDADTKYSGNDAYYEAAENEFPKANIFVGCKSNGTERVETRYCEKCRIAREDWTAKHGS